MTKYLINDMHKMNETLEQQSNSKLQSVLDVLNSLITDQVQVENKLQIFSNVLGSIDSPLH